MISSELIYGAIVAALFLFVLVSYLFYLWFSNSAIYFDRKYGDHRLFECDPYGKVRLTYLYDEEAKAPALKLELYQPGKPVLTSIETFDNTKRGSLSAYHELKIATEESVAIEAGLLLAKHSR